MGPYVKSVRPLDDYQLEVSFDNGELRKFDVKPYMTHGVFVRLRDRSLFKAVRVVAGSVEWSGEIDLSYETLYVKGEPISEQAAEKHETSQVRIEVSDIYDRFYEVANACWKDFEFIHRPDGTTDQLGPSFGDLIDKLEIDLFFAACARRLTKITGIKVSPERIEKMLRLCEHNGEELSGNAAAYHGTAFDWGTPDDEFINNEIVGGDVVNRSREEVKLFLVVDASME